MESDVELLPCPFCGAYAEIKNVYWGDTYYARCTNKDCEMRGLEWLTPEDAYEAWNKRHIPYGQLPSKSE